MTPLGVSLALFSLQSMPLAVLHDLHTPGPLRFLSARPAEGAALQRPHVATDESAGCPLCELTARGRAGVLAPPVDASPALVGVESAARGGECRSHRLRLGPAEPRGPPIRSS